ncbi:hypothetical protein BBP40_005865 [Aspergillus hancockii]|nr:hypothetical protein BBP40_005865 [Aspergillus hancockii]
MPQSSSSTTNASSQHAAPNPPQKYIELRSKQGGLLIKFSHDPHAPTDFKRRKHALSQKNQRDRLKVAFDQMAQVLHTSGVSSGRKGGLCTKVELLETAVEYIQHLQNEIRAHRDNELREG